MSKVRAYLAKVGKHEDRAPKGRDAEQLAIGRVYQNAGRDGIEAKGARRLPIAALSTQVL
jgi:hypothetical protein